MQKRSKRQNEVLRQMGWALRHRRRSLDLRLGEVAARAGISLGYISQVEHGGFNCSILILDKLCRALDVGLGYLFSPTTAEAYHHHLQQIACLSQAAAEDSATQSFHAFNGQCPQIELPH